MHPCLFPRLAILITIAHIVTPCYATKAHLHTPTSITNTNNSNSKNLIPIDDTGVMINSPFTYVCECGFSNITLTIQAPVTAEPQQTCIDACGEHATIISQPCMMTAPNDTRTCNWTPCPEGFHVLDGKGCDHTVPRDICVNSTSTCTSSLNHVIVHQNDIACPVNITSYTCACSWNGESIQYVPLVHISMATIPYDTCRYHCTAAFHPVTVGGTSCSTLNIGGGDWCYEAIPRLPDSLCTPNGIVDSSQTTCYPSGVNQCGGNTVCYAYPDYLDVQPLQTGC